MSYDVRDKIPRRNCKTCKSAVAMTKGELTSVGDQLLGSIHKPESDDLAGRLQTTVPEEQVPWGMLMPRHGDDRFLLPSRKLLTLARDTDHAVQ